MDYPGGAETRLRQVATTWAAAGHRVFLICAKTSSEEPTRSVEDGVTVRRVRVLPDFLLRRFPPPHYLPQALFFVVGPPFVLFYLWRWKIDIVRDSMSPFPGLSILALILRRRTSVVLHILFGGYRDWRKFYSRLYAFMGMVAEKLLLRGWLGYRAIATDSPWLADYIRARLRRDVPVVAIENGVDFKPISRRNARGSIRRFVNAARLVEHKGQTELIEAAGYLREQGIDFELDIFGGGDLESELQEMIHKKGLNDSIRIRPALPHDELMRRLQEYDLYIMPSRSEGLPVILLEAMAAQLPVVVAARPYATTLLEPKTVQMYEPGNAQNLATVISQAVEDPTQAEQRAERGYNWVQSFTWKRTAERELEVVLRAGGQTPS